ncbi:helix-turn-helix transcriptional regulator [Paenibacillus mendelii]|uniref:Helix-turn-helix transcriptional regulator n=1 Tax=Paenibacillus mendelii TaxID=206163 RepID=A0ABV6J2B0_9BACL|nr:helix-turn-helix transcriptional regulator [Paenibacillus mendelii]MCQ6562813.1 helix-turn-helix transcriptional regulator [Paenibacillus mendelii]
MKEFVLRNRVKIARMEQDELTQGELAALVGVTRQTMNLIEAQKYNPTIKVCLLISKHLKTPVDTLFWMED